MYEIKSNHKKTNKILNELEEDGFYIKLYEEQIKEHYKYTGLPSLARGG